MVTMIFGIVLNVSAEKMGVNEKLGSQEETSDSTEIKKETDTLPPAPEVGVTDEETPSPEPQVPETQVPEAQVPETPQPEAEMIAPSQEMVPQMGMKNGFITEDGLLYYYVDDVRQTGWKWIETAWYYMNTEGVVQTGWQWIETAWYYLDEQGAMKTGWIFQGSKWYFLNSNGTMSTGWLWWNGEWYFLYTSGAMVTGWAQMGSTWYYLNDNGTMQREWSFIHGFWYYFKDSGEMYTNWLLWNGNWYYLSPWGTMYVDWHYVDGYKYYFYSNGALCQDVRPYVTGPYWIKVAKQANCVTIYAADGDNGYTIPVKAMVCSTGNATPIGTFYSPVKLRWCPMVGGSYAQFCTRIVGNFLFHSVPYATTNNRTLYTNYYNQLGTTQSLGCIRLTAGDAYWMFYNCGLETPITIYNSWHPGPFSKPDAIKLPIGQRWDPTDPTL